jgi:diguanylate cyclase (GGDEF)-like protein
MKWQRNFLTASQRTNLFFVIVLSSLAGLSLWELKFLDSDRVFLVGEDLWAGAQKRATFCLLSYSISRSSDDLQCFRSEAAVIVGDMQARRELDTKRQTYSTIAKGLIAGRNRPADVPTAIVFYDIAPWNSEAEKAIQIWRDSDQYTLRLIAIADELQHARNDAENRNLRAELLQIDLSLSGMQREFAEHLNNGMHFVALCLCFVQTFFALMLVFLAIIFSRRMLAMQASADKRVRVLAYYDSLTGLPNRILLHERLAAALLAARNVGKKVAVLFLDLDEFKVINDSLGHSVGDLLLKEVAARLQKLIRDQDTVARLGGDEFLVVLAGLEAESDAKQIAERILKAVGANFVNNGLLLNVTCSIGVGLFPTHGDDTETLIKHADAAMYTAKEAGRNRIRYYEEGMDEVVVRRLNLENRLRVALKRQEFYLVYQPQMDIATGCISGFEALLRWDHADLASIPTDKFIRACENSGLIIPIGEWVMRTACQQARKWQQEGLPALPIAINVSAIQFREDGFCDLIKQILNETGLAPEYLELELTEGLLLSNEDVVFGVLKEIRSMGLNLAIDDFGTGYSSLSYLRQFPVTSLKIDKSFIKKVTVNRDDASIVTAIINLGRSLNLKVIAEGVETAEQLSFLIKRRCDGYQGYYLSKPLLAEELVRFFPSFRVPLTAVQKNEANSLSGAYNE